MKSLQEIKTRRQDKGDSLGEPLKVITTTKTISADLSRKKANDIVLQEVEQKKKFSRAYDAELNKKRKLANSLDDKINIKKQLAESEADIIINTAKARATELNAQAEGQLRVARQLKIDINSLKSNLVKKQKELEKEDNRLIDKDLELTAHLSSVSEQAKRLDQEKAVTSHKLEQAKDLLIGLVDIFSAGISRVEALAVLENNLQEELGVVLSQAEKLYNKIEEKELLIKSEQAFAKDRQAEVVLGFEQLKDARKALKMAEKEIMKGKQNGG